MKSNLSLAILLAWAISASAITIETVPVGDVGNPNDPADGDLGTAGLQNLGSVNYAYNIGKYEVTVNQYTAFLNAVAATDTYRLYNANMAIGNMAGISRSGASGSYSYSAIGSSGNRPIYLVSWGDAARFANWMHNGQPTGAQDASTTEEGAYTLNGAGGSALMAITRNANATWFIPTDNEWYKTAYYQPAATGGDSDGYWKTPLKTNNPTYSDQPPGATPDNTRVGNFYLNDFAANGYNDGYAVTGQSVYVGGQNYLTDVGAYKSSPGYYGTFDQAGNVWEWTEKISGGSRLLRGGSWNEDVSGTWPEFPMRNDPSNEDIVYGFRLASIVVPEPSSLLLAVGIFAPLAAYRRRRD